MTKMGEVWKPEQELAKGYVKDPVQLEEHLQIVRGWQEEAEKLEKLLAK